MNGQANIVIHFKDLEADESVREHLESRCGQLASEFPETDRYEVSFDGTLESVECHCHVTGKKTSVAAHVQNGQNIRHAGDQALDKVERELRRDHDKRIFGPRRKAQKERANRFS